MRLPLVIGGIGTIAIVIILVSQIDLSPNIIENDSKNNLINARIEVVENYEKPVFNDEFVIDGLRLSELNISIIDNASSPLEPFIDKQGRVIASMISNVQTDEYLLALGDKTIKLENRDDLLTAEYTNNIIPDRIIIKGDKQIELTVKPFLKEVINNEINYYEIKKIRINEQEIIVEIADDNEKRALGLMYRDYLPEHAGMFFILNKEGITSFWMQNMLIRLDMIWIDEDGKIVDITKNAQPCTDDIESCTYRPDEPVKYVLEVNAGFTDKYDIKEGDVIELYTI